MPCCAVCAQVLTCVFRLSKLTNPQHMYKVEVNARENQLSGLVLQADDMSVVIVEGCNKAIKRWVAAVSGGGVAGWGGPTGWL